MMIHSVCRPKSFDRLHHFFNECGLPNGVP
jgi:hypothetical protein